jgi:hypothetical protein
MKVVGGLDIYVYIALGPELMEMLERTIFKKNPDKYVPEYLISTPIIESGGGKSSFSLMSILLSWDNPRTWIMDPDRLIDPVRIVRFDDEGKEEILSKYVDYSQQKLKTLEDTIYDTYDQKWIRPFSDSFTARLDVIYTGLLGAGGCFVHYIQQTRTVKPLWFRVKQLPGTICLRRRKARNFQQRNNNLYKQFLSRILHFESVDTLWFSCFRKHIYFDVFSSTSGENPIQNTFIHFKHSDIDAEHVSEIQFRSELDPIVGNKPHFRIGIAKRDDDALLSMELNFISNFKNDDSGENIRRHTNLEFQIAMEMREYKRGNVLFEKNLIIHEDRYERNSLACLSNGRFVKAFNNEVVPHCTLNVETQGRSLTRYYTESYLLMNKIRFRSIIHDALVIGSTRSMERAWRIVERNACKMINELHYFINSLSERRWTCVCEGDYYGFFKETFLIKIRIGNWFYGIRCSKLMILGVGLTNRHFDIHNHIDLSFND